MKFEEEEYILSYYNYDFRFALHHVNGMMETGENGYDKYPFIRCSLDRKDNKKINWTWEGYLTPDLKVEFHLIYDDEVNIKGHIRLYHSIETGNNYVFMDAWFGINYEKHFDGNILEIYDNDGPVPPIPPIPPPDPEPPVPVPVPGIPDEIISPADYNDLFPYLYMQYWPGIQPADEPYLVTYPGSLSAASAFYTTLQAFLGQPQARENMENEALDFINGTGTYANEFIPSVQSLPFPLDMYPEVYDSIYNGAFTTEKEVIDHLVKDPALYNDQGPVLPSPVQTGNIWDNIIALSIIEGYQPQLLTGLTKILVVEHLLANLQSPPGHSGNENLEQLIMASLVLPAPVFPLPPFNTPIPDTSLYSGTVVPYAIGDLQMVQHKLRGYEPGEIASIENVMAGEIKKTRHRKAETVEDTVHTHNNNLTTRKQDNRGDQLEREIMQSIQDTTTNEHDYTQLTMSYGPPATGTYGGKVTQTVSNNKAQQGPSEFARMILAKTVSSISQKVSEQRARMLRNETEEIISHIVDNRNGTKNLRGVYWWINKIYDIRQVNYGHRFMMEFIIHKPALLPGEEAAGEFIFPPVPLSQQPTPVVNWTDISESNYVQLGTYYGVSSLPAPPAANKLVNTQLNGANFLNNTSVAIPDGYLPQTVTASYTIDATGITGTLIAGTKQAPLDGKTNPAVITDPMGIFTSPPVEVSAEGLLLPVLVDIPAPVTSPPTPSSFFVSISVMCACSAYAYAQWQKQVYNALTEAYQQQLRHYKMQVRNRNLVNPETVNAFMYKTVKRACKKVLQQVSLTKNGITSPTLSPPETVVNKPAYAQFFNEAWEWEKLSYSLEDTLPSGWKDNFAEDTESQWFADKIDRFMSARQIRVMVPVNVAYNYRTLYYITSGLIFYGEDQLAPAFTTTEQQAIALKKVFNHEEHLLQHVEKTWIVKIPTGMQWLQDGGQLPEVKIEN